MLCCCYLVAKLCLTLLGPEDCSPPGFPGKNTGVGCHFLLQRIIPTQGWNTYLLHWQVISLPLSLQGSPVHAYWHRMVETCSFISLFLGVNLKFGGGWIWTMHIFILSTFFFNQGLESRLVFPM